MDKIKGRRQPKKSLQFCGTQSIMERKTGQQEQRQLVTWHLSPEAERDGCWGSTCFFLSPFNYAITFIYVIVGTNAMGLCSQFIFCHVCPVIGLRWVGRLGGKHPWHHLAAPPFSFVVLGIESRTSFSFYFRQAPANLPRLVLNLLCNPGWS